MADGDEISNEEVKPLASEDSQAVSRSPLVLILLGLNLIILGGLAFMQFQLFEKMSKEEKVTDIVKSEMEKNAIKVSKALKRDDGVLVPLETFTANLAQGDGARRFVRLDAVLKFDRKHSRKEFDARKPQIRDTIISILNSKRPVDLLEKEGKEFLKEEIKTSINNFMIDGNVIDIYYVGFQIN